MIITNLTSILFVLFQSHMLSKRTGSQFIEQTEVTL